MKVYCVVTGGGLRPVSPAEAGKLRALGDGEIVACDIKVSRNFGQLRRYHKLMRMVFDWWEEANPVREVGGVQVAPNYDQFRRDVTIAAGFYTSTFKLDGSLHLDAKSIAYDSMEEPEFKQLMAASIDVLVRQVVPKCTTDDNVAQGMINEILEFS